MTTKYRKTIKRIGILLLTVMLFQTACEPMMLTNLRTVQAATIEEVATTSGETGVIVTNKTELQAALAAKQSLITISGVISIGDQADNTGKMYPVEIPAGTTIQGATADASLTCRCPLQISGDGVVIKNLELTFSSSDALGSVPHREIFLAGHSLTLDNVETYLPGGGDSSLGLFGGSEEELLPSVYAGGFENTTIGTAASLTIQNANSKTMFKSIYMIHES